MDRVEDDATAELGPGAVGVAVIGLRAPAAKVVAKPDRRPHHPAEFAAGGQGLELNQRRQETQVHRDSALGVGLGGVSGDGLGLGRGGGERLVHQHRQAARQDELGLLGVPGAWAGDNCGVGALQRLLE